jgi:hypothetical protein
MDGTLSPLKQTPDEKDNPFVQEATEEDVAAMVWEPLPVTTLLFSIAPLQDLEVQRMKEEVGTLIHYLDTAEVTDDASAKHASDNLSMVAKLKKALEGKRTEYVGPLRDAKDAIDQDFKDIVNPLLESDKRLRQKVATYTAEKMRVADEARRAAALAEAQRLAEIKVDEDTGEVTEPETPQAPLPDKASHLTRGQVGSTGLRMKPMFEVLNPDMVPREYCCPDEKAIRAAVKNGIVNIAGVRIWEEPDVTVR